MNDRKAGVEPVFFDAKRNKKAGEKDVFLSPARQYIYYYKIILYILNYIFISIYNYISISISEEPKWNQNGTEMEPEWNRNDIFAICFDFTAVLQPALNSDFQ